MASQAYLELTTLESLEELIQVHSQSLETQIPSSPSCRSLVLPLIKKVCINAEWLPIESTEAVTWSEMLSKLAGLVTLHEVHIWVNLVPATIWSPLKYTGVLEGCRTIQAALVDLDVVFTLPLIQEGAWVLKDKQAGVHSAVRLEYRSEVLATRHSTLPQEELHRLFRDLVEGDMPLPLMCMLYKRFF